MTRGGLKGPPRFFCARSITSHSGLALDGGRSLQGVADAINAKKWQVSRHRASASHGWTSLSCLAISPVVTNFLIAPRVPVLRSMQVLPMVMPVVAAIALRRPVVPKSSDKKELFSRCAVRLMAVDSTASETRIAWSRTTKTWEACSRDRAGPTAPKDSPAREAVAGERGGHMA